jgi:hypothetical protein
MGLDARQSITDSTSAISFSDISRPVPDSAATLREPPDTPAWAGDDTSAASRGASVLRESGYQSNPPSPQENVEQNMSLPSSPSGYLTCSSPEPILSQPLKKGRYYAHALSDEDKQALAVGKKNHNQKQWAPIDLFQYHDSRIELVPYCEERAEILKFIAEDKRSSMQSDDSPLSNGRNAQANVGTQVCPRSGMPAIKLTSSQVGNTATHGDEKIHQRPFLSRNATQSMIDLRIPSPQASVTPSRSSALVEHTQSLDSREGNLRRFVRSRPASTGDRLTSYQGRQTQAQSRNSSLSTESSSRVRSPLAHEYKANVTFDSFLVPHKSGMGETYHDGENAEKEPKTPDSSSQLRRLSKMPSIPMMRKRRQKLSGNLLDV